MNKIFAVLAVLMPFLASGQSEKVVFGVKAGLNYNNIIVKGANLDIPLGQFNPALEGKEVKGTGGFNFDPLTSWYAGVTVDVPVKKMVPCAGRTALYGQCGQGSYGCYAGRQSVYSRFPDFNIPSGEAETVVPAGAGTGQVLSCQKLAAYGRSVRRVRR